MTPEATRVQEVVLDRHDEVQLDGPATSKPVVVETSEVVDSCGCPVNLGAVKDAIKDIPPEYKETACTMSLVLVSLAGLFFSIVLYRYFYHTYIPEPQGFFCRCFAEPFSPIFDALCEVEPLGGFFHEMRRNSQVLAGELQDAVFDFIHSVVHGFHALLTIFGKLIGGLVENIGCGIHELVENVHENLSFVLGFCMHFVHGIVNALSNSARTASDTFHSMSQNVYL